MDNIYFKIKGIVMKVLSFITITTSIIIPATLFIQVVYRYIFKKPIQGIEELAVASFIWLIIFGSVISFSNNQHIIVDSFMKNSSTQTKRTISIINNIIIIIILSILIYSCYIALPNQAYFKTVVLKIPRTAHTKALIVSFVLMTIQCIENLVNYFHKGNKNGTLTTD